MLHLCHLTSSLQLSAHVPAASVSPLMSWNSVKLLHTLPGNYITQQIAEMQLFVSVKWINERYTNTRFQFLPFICSFLVFFWFVWLVFVSVCVFCFAPCVFIYCGKIQKNKMLYNKKKDPTGCKQTSRSENVKVELWALIIGWFLITWPLSGDAATFTDLTVIKSVIMSLKLILAQRHSGFLKSVKSWTRKLVLVSKWNWKDFCCFAVFLLFLFSPV